MSDDKASDRAWRVLESVATAVILAGLALLWKWDAVGTLLISVLALFFGWSYLQLKKEGHPHAALLVGGTLVGGLVTGTVLAQVFD
ncbi:hypothetical protein ACFY0G_37380 [Streptomyces sp. NPDC001552]|uniref:hypothetical protein n=1 Tax=Streptomyces sp. NPDC001552 TaxID=3364587 RepID=UPI0036AF9AC4